MKALANLRRILRRESEFDLRELPGLLGRDDPVILEVGCNDGSHTLRFLELFPRATVYCFEPDPRARERFGYLVRSDRAKLFPFAVSDRDGTATFHASGGQPPPEWRVELPKGWDGSGSLKTPTGHIETHPWCKFDETFEVETRRLDSWREAEGVARVDFVWADVQGAEAELIGGGPETFALARFFYTECMPRPLYEGAPSLKELLRLLPNYRVLKRFTDDVLLRNENAGR
ncbi:MAG TPA: FkbM family methyltransferase [Pyrinomonadaceae bacterium]|nr:FkbM family methyltransferase [Pyrinomonadaceae bacterium]